MTSYIWPLPLKKPMSNAKTCAAKKPGWCISTFALNLILTNIFRVVQAFFLTECKLIKNYYLHIFLPKLHKTCKARQTFRPRAIWYRSKENISKYITNIFYVWQSENIRSCSILFDLAFTTNFIFFLYMARLFIIHWISY